MPTYSYVCNDCGNSFTLFHYMSDTSEKHCPECEGVAERQFGTGTLVSSSHSSSGGYSAPPIRSGFS